MHVACACACSMGVRMWHVTRGMWHVACAMWHVACGMGMGVYRAAKPGLERLGAHMYACDMCHVAWAWACTALLSPASSDWVRLSLWSSTSSCAAAAAASAASAASASFCCLRLMTTIS